jgi:hypothetical protein
VAYRLFSFFATGNSHAPSAEFTNSLSVIIMAAGRPHTKSRKPFQNHEYIHAFTILRKVRSIKSEVENDKKL